MTSLTSAELHERLEQIETGMTGGALAVSAYDPLSRAVWRYKADRWFHAASVIKIAVLLAAFDAARQDRFQLDARLHVRNRFLSAADGTPFRVDSRRDGDTAVHGAIGRTMRVRDLARRMIVTSSNLATNLLIDLVTVPAAHTTLERLGVQGVELRRGVEDERAFEAGIINRMTANGAVALLETLLDRVVWRAEDAAEMLDMLAGQEFAGTIAPGLPEPLRAVSRVAHKTGEISTATHDAGLVFLPGRPPFVVAIFTESTGDVRERVTAAVAASAAVYERIAAAGQEVRG